MLEIFSKVDKRTDSTTNTNKSATKRTQIFSQSLAIIINEKYDNTKNCRDKKKLPSYKIQKKLTISIHLVISECIIK